MDKVNENYYRRMAKRLDLILQKSRGRKWSVNDQQGYRIIDKRRGILQGERFELTIDDVAKFLEGYEVELKTNPK